MRAERAAARQAAAVIAASAHVGRRRSARLAAGVSSSAAANSEPPAPSVSDEPAAPKQRRGRPRKAPVASGGDEEGVKFPHGTLPRTYELEKEKAGFRCVVGVDEAGRGPLAGPVVAAACFVPTDVSIEGVHDSKKLSEPQREALFEQLTTHPRVRYAVHVNSAQRIDEINILQASLESMALAVDAMPSDARADYVFVDGNRLPAPFVDGGAANVKASFVIKGDSKVFSIAAASIIAKVTRDRLMREYDEKYPGYGLAQHKGYPTAAHMAAIAKLGATAIHRMTFAPLKPKEPKKSKKVETSAEASSKKRKTE